MTTKLLRGIDSKNYTLTKVDGIWCVEFFGKYRHIKFTHVTNMNVAWVINNLPGYAKGVRLECDSWGRLTSVVDLEIDLHLDNIVLPKKHPSMCSMEIGKCYKPIEINHAA